MKKQIAVATLFLLAVSSSFAFDPPRNGQTAKQQGAAQKRGSRNGKKIGPQDGSGPIHQPGTGGGTGAGRRNGRR